MKTQIFAALFFLCAICHSQEVRLDSIGMSMEHVKTRNQINHICYAHAAADMVDSVRFFLLHDTNFHLRTSPLALAIMDSKGYKDKEKKSFYNFFEWGQICSAVETAVKKGIKDFKDVDAIVFQGIVGPELSSHWKDANLLTIEEQVQTRDLFNGYFLEIFQDYHKMSLRSREYARMGYLGYVNTWLNLLSPNLYKFNEHMQLIPKCKKMKLESKKKNNKHLIVSAMITNHFKIKYDKNNKKQAILPIGLDFCERYVNHGIVGRIGMKVERNLDCDRHATTIIGYRVKVLENGINQNQVLIKNSRPCHFMSKQFECKDNKIWVPLNGLLQSSMSIHYFKL